MLDSTWLLLQKKKGVKRDLNSAGMVLKGFFFLPAPHHRSSPRAVLSRLDWFFFFFNRWLLSAGCLSPGPECSHQKQAGSRGPLHCVAGRFYRPKPFRGLESQHWFSSGEISLSHLALLLRSLRLVCVSCRWRPQKKNLSSYCLSGWDFPRRWFIPGFPLPIMKLNDFPGCFHETPFFTETALTTP